MTGEAIPCFGFINIHIQFEDMECNNSCFKILFTKLLHENILSRYSFLWIIQMNVDFENRCYNIQKFSSDPRVFFLPVHVEQFRRLLYMKACDFRLSCTHLLYAQNVYSRIPVLRIFPFTSWDSFRIDSFPRAESWSLSDYPFRCWVLRAETFRFHISATR